MGAAGTNRRFWLNKILFFLGSEVLTDEQRATGRANYTAQPAPLCFLKVEPTHLKT